MRFINALLAMAATALAMAGVASAAPSVSFTWTATSSLGAPGSDSITAAVGDTLTLQSGNVTRTSTNRNVTIDSNIVLGASGTWNINTAGSDTGCSTSFDSYHLNFSSSH